MEAILEKPSTDLVKKAFETQKKAISTRRTETIGKRKERIQKLRKWIHANLPLIREAAYADFRKPATEVDSTEVFHVLAEIKHALGSLDQWAAPKKVDAPLTMLGTRSFIQYEPRGVCLIISPWNYPFSLSVGPLVAALAAGNSVIMKPSELTPHVSGVLKKMVTAIFSEDEVSLVEGDADVSQYLLSLPFDHVFFTGSPAVGKLVMRAAAENLTSVTLELGGKSPAIVTSSANIKEAAQRIAVGKFINNGQTCIAPDFILADESIAGAFIEAIKEQTKKLFTENDQPFDQSPHYGRIVSEKHFNRINSLVQDALNRGAKLEYGGKVDQATRFIHPMVLSQVSLQSKVMEEEIFGPVLPIVTYKKLDEAIALINDRPKPLALYVFTKEKKDRENVLRETSSGAVCVNDCAIHFLHDKLPFGGVNNSGIGKSHGYFGFLAFSNEKPVLRQKGGLTSFQPFFPPYTVRVQKMMNWFLKLF